MVAIAMALLAAASTVSGAADNGTGADASVQSMVQEESPEVFLAKATLQQYLSRVVRKDWQGARRLTHPKTLAAIADMKKRTGEERHNLAPWANKEDQLKQFRFGDARRLQDRPADRADTSGVTGLLARWRIRPRRRDGPFHRSRARRLP